MKPKNLLRKKHALLFFDALNSKCEEYKSGIPIDIDIPIYAIYFELLLLQ